MRNISERILVIGAGVVGLTTALCLLREGFQVTIIADKFSPQITSNVAGALWEWPPAVCGHHRNPVSLERSKHWCMVSYNFFEELALQAKTGVQILSSVFFFRHPVTEHNGDFLKMKEIESRLKGFRYDYKLIEENSVSTKIGLKDAYEHLAPVVDTDIYMGWLLEQINQLGGKVLKRKVSGRLVDIEEKLKTEFDSAAIVNCAGLGSVELADDDMYPLRGALIRVHNDDLNFPKINKALSITLEERGNSQNMIYLVPRGNILLLGGLVEKDEWFTDIQIEKYEPLRQMYQRCIDFLPMLKRAKLDIDEPIRVGLRPARKTNVRLEQEKGTTIIHNYGHGGSGVTLSWGCAIEVVEKIKSVVQQQSNKQLVA
ncbi:MAG: FAD-dependent oxidoreductase [Rivularia sp. (in: cyanobacteria)]